MKSENRSVQAVPEFVSRVTETLDLVGGSSFCRHPRVFRHRLGNRGVETLVERMELFDRDGGTLFDRERRDRLAHVAIVVNDLGDRKTQSEPVPAVARRRRPDGVGGDG